MRTLGLLAALLVLALPGWAEPLEGATELVADTLAPTALAAEQARDAEEQAPMMDGQEQPEDEKQDVAVSFFGDEQLTREVAAQGKNDICRCRRRPCRQGERVAGRCPIRGGVQYLRCCY